MSSASDSFQGWGRYDRAREGQSKWKVRARKARCDGNVDDVEPRARQLGSWETGTTANPTLVEVEPWVNRDG